MAPFQEDIFGCYPAQTIIIRYGEPTRKKFEAANNNVHFEKFKDTLSKREYTCYFTKQKDKEHRIYIPVDDFHGRVELVVSKRDPNTNTYKLEVNKQKQTRICAASIEDIPEDKYRIEQVCRLFFIESNAEYDDWDVISELNKLIKRVESLEISPKTLVENQREIWTKYIEAQEFIIKNLQVPFECKGDTYLEEIKNNNKVTRYKLRLPLAQAFENDYNELENELQNKLNLDCKFDMDGAVKLKFSDIRYLDNAIKYKFPAKYERDPRVICIAKIKPLTLVQRLIEELPNSKIVRDKNRILISSRQPVKAIDDAFARFRMYRCREYAATFEIMNVDDLYSHYSVKRYNLTFGPGDKYLKKETTSGLVPMEMLLPAPINCNTFKVCKQDRTELVRFYLSLCNIYGRDNISVSEFLVYAPQLYDDVLNDRQFDDETWNFIRRELAYNYQINEKKDEKELVFEFVQFEELKQKVQELLALHSFAFVKNPLDEDFQFKVKTAILAKKSQRQLFEEKLQKLRGAEFVCLRDSQKDNEKARSNIGEVYIGKLAPESSHSQLVFNIPMHFKEDKERASEFLSFINTEPKIKSVHANLRGDESKTKWLREAMDKLKDGSQNSLKPNSYPINDNIKNFIFDSSKARPTVKFDLTDIRETPEFIDSHKYEILEINESQREAVLKAVQANDLCLLQGPPGTGKTTVIAELIWQHIRLNQSQRILLTSETNLAVDNALEKMMSEKNIRRDLAQYITIIKPLRFGKATRFEEEGKKYSIQRIDKWVEEEYVQEEQYVEEQLGQEGDKTEFVDVEIEVENTDSNAVQDWMRHIADRADQKNEKYSEVLKNWTSDLVYPDKETKLYFRNKYFKYTNVIGSTCSSTGSPAFAREYVGLYHSVPDDFNKKKKEVEWLVENAPQSPKIRKLLTEMGVSYGDDLGNDANSYKELLKDFLKIDFDVVVMDEASKATPPDLLMPLCFGKKSIVIGDHRQLPPMLHSRTFKETLETISDEKFKSQIDDIIDKEFVETSQFKRMITNPSLSPTIKSTFDTQYRMHPDINDVINQFYLDDESGGLHCGLDLKSVNDPKLENPQSRYHGFSCEGFINENVHTIWIDVDAPEKIDGTSRVNATEVEAVKHVLELLKKSHGFDEYMKFWDEHVLDKTKRKFEKEVGIISFYGKQVALLRDVRLTAQKAGIPIRLNTVDKFQGMERNIVIVSTVRSDKRDDGNQKIVPNNDYGFAESAERLNVALSRAKRLLIVIGNKEFFYKAKSSDGKPLYKNAIDSIRKHGRIIDYEKLRNELD